jgi:hypothetical protein
MQAVFPAEDSLFFISPRANGPDASPIWLRPQPSGTISPMRFGPWFRALVCRNPAFTRDKLAASGGRLTAGKAGNQHNEQDEQTKF